jgi:hypothetical protein
MIKEQKIFLKKKHCFFVFIMDFFVVIFLVVFQIFFLGGRYVAVATCIRIMSNGAEPTHTITINT